MWAEKLRAHALENNIVLSPESEVMPELLTIVAANPLSVLPGFNMASIDALSTKDAALRCEVQWLFEAAHDQMDLYQMPVIRALRNVFPVGSDEFLHLRYGGNRTRAPISQGLRP